MKTTLYRMICCACLAGLLLACQPAPAGPTPISEPVTLTFIAPSEYQRLYAPAIEKFKEVEPNITVTIKSQGFSQQIGDVTLVRWYEVAEGGYLESGDALDLTPFLQQDTLFNPEDYLPGALETFRTGDKQFVLPTGVDPFVIFYNQDLFDQLGVPYPQPGWTLDDFRTAALLISEPSAGIYGYAPSNFYFDSMFFAFQFGGTLIDPEQQPRLDSPEMVRALEWYASLFGSGGVAPNREQMNEAYGMGMRDVGIVTGKVGMWMGSVSSLTSELGGMLKFPVGVVPLPRGEQGLSLAQYEGLMISAEAGNPQAAWRLVSFLADQIHPWIYPARKSLAESEEYTALVGKDQSAAVRAAVDTASQVSGLDFGRYRGVMMLFFSAVGSAVDGGIPAAEALRGAQEDVIQP